MPSVRVVHSYDAGDHYYVELGTCADDASDVYPFEGGDLHQGVDVSKDEAKTLDEAKIAALSKVGAFLVTEHNRSVPIWDGAARSIDRKLKAEARLQVQREQALTAARAELGAKP